MPVDTRTRASAEDRGNQIRERLSRAGASLGQQRPALLDDGCDRFRHQALTFPRLVAVEDAGERASVRESLADGGL